MRVGIIRLYSTSAINEPYKFALKDFCLLSFIFSVALSKFLMNNCANTLNCV